MSNEISVEVIASKILIVRGKRVMLGNDLAQLYEVSTKRLNEQVRRNIERFPNDFMFQLTKEEWNSLRSHFATLNKEEMASKRGKHVKYLPYVFTQEGVAMLSSVLNSDRAIQVNIQIMRVFVKLRRILSTHKELAHKLKELERKIEKHDEEIQGIFEAIRQLMQPPEEPKKRIIGFQVEK